MTRGNNSYYLTYPFKGKTKDLWIRQSEKYPRYKWVKYQQKSSESRYSYARMWSSPMASAITKPLLMIWYFTYSVRSCSKPKVSFVSIFVCIRPCMPKTDNPDHSPSYEWFNHSLRGYDLHWTPAAYRKIVLSAQPNSMWIYDCYVQNGLLPCMQ